jgi:hypothetical protein
MRPGPRTCRRLLPCLSSQKKQPDGGTGTAPSRYLLVIPPAAALTARIRWRPEPPWKQIEREGGRGSVGIQSSTSPLHGQESVTVAGGRMHVGSPRGGGTLEVPGGSGGCCRRAGVEDGAARWCGGGEACSTRDEMASAGLVGELSSAAVCGRWGWGRRRKYLERVTTALRIL